MADKPIIFSAPMVRALIEGRKTQTRRVLKPQPELIDEDRVRCVEYKGQVYSGNTRVPYATDDRLWVKEAVTWVSARGWRYRADNDDLSEKREQGEVCRWRSPIHMPRSASRLTPTVTDVRVQRVQEISEADAVAEGVNPCLEGYQCPDGPHWRCCAMYDPKGRYAALWNSLHAKPKPVKGPDGKVSHYVSYPWESVQETRTFRGLPWIVTGNPWVAAYTFTVQRGNIDGGKA